MSKSIEDDFEELLKCFMSDQDSKQYVQRHVKDLKGKNKHVNREIVSNYVLGFVDRFDRSGLFQYAPILQNAYQIYIGSENKDKDKWSMLWLLVNLSSNAVDEKRIIQLENELKLLKSADETNSTNSEYFSCTPVDSDESKQTEVTEDVSFNFVAEILTVESEEEDLSDEGWCEKSVELKKTEEVAVTQAPKPEMKKLNLNIQKPWWWFDTSFTAQRTYRLANFGIHWHLMEQTRLHLLRSKPKCDFLNEYKIIRELLWMFTVNPSKDNTDRVEYFVSTVSPPSVIQMTFASFIRDLLKSAHRYRNIVKFIKKMENEDSEGLIVFSLRLYCQIMKKICISILCKIQHIERNVFQQDDEICSLLRIVHKLRPITEEINFINEIHEKCTSFDWTAKPSWISVVRLLSILSDKLKVTRRIRDVNILLLLFLGIFRFYVDIIDKWISTGVLQDPREEFFLSNNVEEVGQNDYIDWKSLENVVVPSDIIKKSADILFQCKGNITVLNTLNKLQSNQFKNDLYDEFINSVQNHPSFHKIGYDWNNWKTHGIDFTVEPKEIAINEDLIMRPFEIILRNTFMKLLLERRQKLCSLFAFTIMDQFHIFQQIGALGSFVLMNFNTFSRNISIQLDNDDKKNRNGWMQHFLNECMKLNKIQYRHLIKVTFNDFDYENSSKFTVVKATQLIQNLNIKYKAEWPVNQIIDEELLKEFYKPLLQFIMKFNIALYSVMRLNPKDLSSKIKSTTLRIEYLRHSIVKIIRLLFSIFLPIVDKYFRMELSEKTINVEDFTNIKYELQKHFRNAEQICALFSEENEKFNLAMAKMFNVCDDVQLLWKRCTIGYVCDVEKVMNSYMESLRYLSEAIEDKATIGQQSPLRELHTQLSITMEAHGR